MPYKKRDYIAVFWTYKAYKTTRQQGKKTTRQQGIQDNKTTRQQGIQDNKTTQDNGKKVFAL